MGIWESVPNRVVPHTTSGRADYFGTLVNRSVALGDLHAQEKEKSRPLLS